jgi:hypothetical protein
MPNHALLAGASLLVLCAALPAHAALTPGSGNVAVIEPPVVVPKETPCIVPLVTDAIFGANNATYAYTPPAACPGPWARVVLKVDVKVQKGIQYDRTGTLWMAGVPLWFGTTAEPNPSLGPSWHFERDVTQYSALFKTPQTGFELIANYACCGGNVLIESDASLLFYPPTASFPATRTADLVLPFSAPGGGTVGLNDPTDMLSTTVTLPTNVKSATLQVYAQGQSGDEFWYTCVPDTYATELESCGGGAFREGEVTVDGTPAGVTPVYPWIFTGGIDPYLWAPIPGVQTLSFTPFSVPLTPFAGPLSNGAPHTIALSVYGDNSYFSAAGALLITLDPTTPTVTGTIKSNTLAAAPKLVVKPHITTGQNATTGRLNTSARHNFTIVGEIITSAGKVTDTVTQTTEFSNDQYFDITASKYVQNIKQTTATSVHETSAGGSGTGSDVLQTYLYPLTVGIAETSNDQGGGTQLTTINQERQTSRTALQSGLPANQSNSLDTVNTTDTLMFNSSGQITGHKDQSETAGLLTSGTKRPCFKRTLQAANSLLTAVTTGCSK